MAKRTELALGAVGALICAGVLWFALAPVEAPVQSSAPVHASSSPTVATELAEVSDTARAVELDSAVEVERASAAAAAEPTFDTEGAIWVEGRVVFPPGTPKDERIEILGWFKYDPSIKPHRARVAGDGSFRVAFPKGTVLGWISMRARYLYLHSSIELALDERVDPLVLRPELGGLLRVRFTLPRGAEDRASELVGLYVFANIHNRARSENDAADTSRTVDVEDPSGVEIGGLVPGILYSVTANPESFPPIKVRGQSVAAGAVSELEIPLEMGVNISGEVVGEDDRPIAGAKFRAIAMRGNATSYIDRKTETDESGRFALRGMPAGSAVIHAFAPNYLMARVRVDVPEGSAKDDLRFVLPRGRSIRGRVQMSDGRPAANAKLRVALSTSMDSNRQYDALGWRGEPPEHVAAADGSFEIHGLTEGPFVLLARAADESGISVRMESVASGGEPIVMTLDAAHVLTGRVVDDLGHGVARFRVDALPPGVDGDWDSMEERVRGKRQGETGAFTIAGLRAGTWRITVRGDGGLVSREVTLPTSDPPLEILLPRPASISGIVVDPSGAPARGARVGFCLTTSQHSTTEALATSEPTDELGRFTLDAVSSGPGVLTARHLTFAPSEATRLDLAPGDARTGVQLMLRASGRITGEVLDKEGRPDPARSVYAFGNGGAEGISIFGETDGEGRFEFDGLPAGDYWIQTQSSAAEREAQRDADGKTDWQVLQNLTRRAQAKVVAGQTAHVVLGEPPRAPVRVRGLVTQRGRPVARIGVAATRSRHSGGAAPETKTANTKDDGRYELVLSEPGPHWFRVTASSRGTSVQRQETIPETNDHTIDFDLPAGRIAGRVLGPEGDPLANVQMQVRAKTMAALEFGKLQTNYGYSTSDEKGRFAFDYLMPGIYFVHASLSYYGEEGGPRYGPMSSGEIEIGEDTKVENLEFRLQFAARLDVSVVGPSGEPAGGAEVFAFEESGATLEHTSAELTDAAGRRLLGGLPARPLLLFARKDSLASAVVGPVRLRSGELDTVKLELRPGTFVDVVTEGPEGPKPMQVEVRDERGIAFSALRSTTHKVTQRESACTGGYTLGPVPPGRYRAKPRDAELAAHAVDFIVAGEESVCVKIALPK